jgi:stress-induced morphogen
MVRQLQESIAGAIDGAQVEVLATSPGHFAIRVTSERFAGQSRVVQQQSVYSAIAHLMQGDEAPVHAIDRLQTLAP